MNKTLSFVRLDFITIKPYLTVKNLLLFFVVALILNINAESSASTISFLMVYAAIFISFPFAVGEKNGIDALYAVLSIKRRTVVLGRYLFALIIDVCAGLMAFVLSFLVMFVMQKGFNTQEVLITMLVTLLICSLIQAIQLPIFFKLGYTKAKFITYLPFLGLFLVFLVLAWLIKAVDLAKQPADFFGWFAANPLIAVLIGAVIWLGIMAVSCQASCRYYNKRDF